MRAEEDGHRHRLLDLYRQKFGDHIPLIRRQDVKGFVQRRPVWLVRPLGLDAVRKQAEMMEVETRRFYESAARKTTDAGVRQLLGDLAEEERKHERIAEELEAAAPPAAARGRGGGPAAAVRAAGDPAGPGGADGRLGLDAGADLRRGVRHASAPGTPSWSAWRPASGPASAWASPRRCPTTAA